MKKKIAVVSNHLYSSKIYSTLISSLFGNYLDIDIYSIEDESIARGIFADLIVISSFTIFETVKKYVKNNAEIIISNYTITKEGHDKLMQLPQGARAMLVNINAKVCMETISLIYQLGCRDLALTPVYPGKADIPDLEIAITPGESDRVPEHVKRIIDIGHRVLDISTIADIAAKLDLQKAINEEPIKKYFAEIMPTSYGLEKMLGENNSLNSQLEILLEILDQGIIIVNPLGTVISYNQCAESVLGISKVKAMTNNYIKLFPQIAFEQVLESLKPIKNKLVRINDNDIEFSVSPISNQNILYGAVAVISKFSESEKKQHILRTQLLGKGHRAKYTLEKILGSSEVIMQCKSIAKRMASSDAAILITGEGGTGKELFAQGIHNASARREYQFVAVNCAAMPESLLESELFGYEGGAFTGAKKEGKPGLFELAHNGTLFLDEIGDMPMTLQARLLRVLQEKTVMRIGGDTVINVNVRIVCATNKELRVMVNQNKFRNDLYFRISVLPLNLPPLRERKHDILLIVDAFKKNFNTDFILTQEATQKILEYDWQGNVRELRNCVEYLTNLNKDYIDVSDLLLVGKSEEAGCCSNYEPDVRANEFLKINMTDIKCYTSILDLLNKSYKSQNRTGRRSLAKQIKAKDIYLTEQEIRGILLKLESYGFVEIRKGRAGTIITESGQHMLEFLEKKQ